ncbi:MULTISPECIES: hypothetical protein [Antarcticibacterium]|uniref:hypothetical protein n=1 Tax=Antarcticibacterium TaxID=2058174 RepID=UPI00143D3BCF|nr:MULTISPECIES: hypothetical protein [Antarcticibacterium]
MKKVYLIMCILLCSTVMISCTEENLADLTDPGTNVYASDGEDSKTDPKEEPPGGD